MDSYLRGGRTLMVIWGFVFARKYSHRILNSHFFHKQVYSLHSFRSLFSLQTRKSFVWYHSIISHLPTYLQILRDTIKIKDFPLHEHHILCSQL